jgi:hypothetical protein
MVDSVETSTTMDTLKTMATKKHLKTKRRALQKPPTPPATPKMEANKVRAQSSRFLQPQANKVVLRTTTMARKRRLKLLTKRSDLQKNQILKIN